MQVSERWPVHYDGSRDSKEMGDCLRDNFSAIESVDILSAGRALEKYVEPA